MENDHGRVVRGRAWAWLFPATYVVHLAEEYGAGEGFYEWVSHLGAPAMPEERFLTLASLGLVLFVMAAALAHASAELSWIPAVLATIVLVNGVLHPVASLATVTYSPGTVSGVLLWIPLGILGLRRSLPLLRRRTAVAAVIAGVAIHGLVTWVALGG